MTRATVVLKKFDEAAKSTHPTTFTVMRNLTLVYGYRGSDKTIWIPTSDVTEDDDTNGELKKGEKLTFQSTYKVGKDEVLNYQSNSGMSAEFSKSDLTGLRVDGSIDTQ